MFKVQICCWQTIFIWTLEKNSKAAHFWPSNSHKVTTKKRHAVFLLESLLILPKLLWIWKTGKLTGPLFRCVLYSSHNIDKGFSLAQFLGHGDHTSWPEYQTYFSAVQIMKCDLQNLKIGPVKIRYSEVFRSLFGFFLKKSFFFGCSSLTIEYQPHWRSDLTSIHKYWVRYECN